MALEMPGTERFDDVEVGAGVQAGVFFVLCCDRGEHHDQRVTDRSNAFDGLEPADAGHPQVDGDDSRVCGAHRGETVEAVGCRQDRETGPFEYGVDEGAEVVVIFDHDRTPAHTRAHLVPVGAWSPKLPIPGVGPSSGHVCVPKQSLPPSTPIGTI